MGDLKQPVWMVLKAGLFAVIICTCAILLWMNTPTWETAFLIALLIWSSARLYYFLFYVIEKYIDPSYRFSGVFAALKYLVSKKK